MRIISGLTIRATTVALCALFLLGAARSPGQAPQGQGMPKAMVAERVKGFDANKDGKITREEFKGPAGIFMRIDKNGDGTIAAEELAGFGKEEGTVTVGGGAGKGAKGGKGGKKKEGAAAGGAIVGSIPAGVKALSEMTAEDQYKGEDGGLYGKGMNTPPKQHLEAALKAAKSIEPLDADGKPAKDGKIGFISFGMSNTTMEFQVFQKTIEAVKLPPALVVVDGAQGGMEATAWATGRKNPRTGGTPWDELASRLKAAGLTPNQVQVMWVKQAVAGPAKDGEYPEHVKKFQEFTVTALQKLKTTYPNLRLGYFSNRIYAGYAVTQLNPEPYAYEYAYGIRGLIQDQIAGKAELNSDPAKGEVKAPLLLWGPDLWANGEHARKDGLSWSKNELGPDGTHPSDIGRQKVAQMLLNFLQSDPTAKIWFVGK